MKKHIFNEDVINLIFDFYSSKKDDLKFRYNWKINTNRLPKIIRLEESGSLFQKNIELKEKLFFALKGCSKNKRIEILKYYVKDWGGIRGNSEETLNNYFNASNEELIQNGIKGIASWSKILSIHDYLKYAIFDARVSASINSIIKQSNIPSRIFFPVLPSRNTVINPFNKDLISFIRLNNESVLSPDRTYQTYLEIIGEVARKHNVEIFMIEMCLFTYAEELVMKTKK